METSQQSALNSPHVAESSRDVFFECPECQKSMVADESLVGQVIECPQCHLRVIVPAKPAPKPEPPPPPTKEILAKVADAEAHTEKKRPKVDSAPLGHPTNTQRVPPQPITPS